MATAAVTVSASRSVVNSGSPVAISWSTVTATNTGALSGTPAVPDTCIASGSWSGAKNSYAGSEVDTTPAVGDATYTLTCGAATASTTVHVIDQLQAGSPELMTGDAVMVILFLAITFAAIFGWQAGRTR